MLQFVLIFGCGVILDLLHAKYVKSIANRHSGHAMIASMSITLMSLLVWGTVLKDLESHGVFGAIALAGGSGLGTFVSLKRS